MPKPNFFIIGAPKCGTTALSEYLKDHPNVFISPSKEPHYFSPDIPKYRLANSIEEYLHLFDNATDKHTMIGEASVFYLYSKKAAQLIKEFNPAAKIIIMLRNPIDLVHSMHSQLLYTRDEDIEDFAKAWSFIEKRKMGESIPKYCRDRKLLFYDEIAKLGEQLERIYNVFPEQQIEIIFSEDFFNDTEAVYKEVLEFLNLPYDGRTDFPKINKNKQHKLSKLADFTQRPPEWLVNIVLNIKNAIGLKRIKILQSLRNINSVETIRAPIDASTKLLLINNYRDDIVRLSELTGKDLNHWFL